MNIKFAVILVILSLGMIKSASSENECKNKQMSMLVTAGNAKHSLNQKIQLPLWDCSKDVISTTVSEFTYRAIGLRMMEADLLFKRMDVCAAVNDPPAERARSNITTPVKTRLSFEEFVTIFGPIMSLLDPKYFVCLKEQEELIETQNSSNCQFSLTRLMKCVLSMHCAFSVLEYVFLYIDGCPEISSNRDVTAFKNFLEDPFSGLSANFRAMIPGSPEAMEMEIVEDIVELIRLIETVRKVLLKYLSVNERMEQLIKFCEQTVKVRKELEKYEKEFWFYIRCEKARKTCFDAHSKGGISYRSLYLYDMATLKPKRGSTAKLTPKTKSNDTQRAEKSTQSKEEPRKTQITQHTFADRREQFWVWYKEYVNSWTTVDISDLCNSLKYGDKEKLNMPTDPADSQKWFTALFS